MKTDVSLQLAAMKKIISQNLKECCGEIVDMHATGILSADGFVRKAAAELTDETFKNHQIIHAERCVNTLAIQFTMSSYKL